MIYEMTINLNMFARLMKKMSNRDSILITPSNGELVDCTIRDIYTGGHGPPTSQKSVVAP
jgi:hypothetical protein